MMAGKLRHQIIVEQRHETPDEHGNPKLDWRTLYQAWANVEPVDGGKARVGDQIVSGVTHTVTMRFRSVDPRNRIRFGERTFDINAARNVGERCRELVLLCKENV